MVSGSFPPPPLRPPPRTVQVCSKRTDLEEDLYIYRHHKWDFSVYLYVYHAINGTFQCMDHDHEYCMGLPAGGARDKVATIRVRAPTPICAHPSSRCLSRCLSSAACGSSSAMGSGGGCGEAIRTAVIRAWSGEVCGTWTMMVRWANKTSWYEPCPGNAFRRSRVSV